MGDFELKKEKKSDEDNKEKFSLFTCSKKEFKEWFDPL
jgi:hypothetical protein